LSEAIEGGLYHYGCKCWHVSFFEGVTSTDYQGEQLPSFTWYKLNGQAPDVPDEYAEWAHLDQDRIILLVREVMEMRGMRPQQERSTLEQWLFPRRTDESNPFQNRVNQYLASKFGVGFSETNEVFQVYLTAVNILADALMQHGASPESVSDSYIDSMFEAEFARRLNTADAVGLAAAGAVVSAVGTAAGTAVRRIAVGRNNIPFRNISDLPQNVQDAFHRYNNHGWRGTPPGVRNVDAGRLWRNDRGQLPTHDRVGNPITYREFDVNSRIIGQNRDAQRFLVGNDGSIFFTDNHYASFIRIR